MAGRAGRDRATYDSADRTRGRREIWSTTWALYGPGPRGGRTRYSRRGSAGRLTASGGQRPRWPWPPRQAVPRSVRSPGTRPSPGGTRAQPVPNRPPRQRSHRLTRIPTGRTRRHPTRDWNRLPRTPPAQQRPARWPAAGHRAAPAAAPRPCPAQAADLLHHQAVISWIRSTCQDAATKPHGDASRTSRRLRSGPARRISLECPARPPCGTGRARRKSRAVHGLARLARNALPRQCLAPQRRQPGLLQAAAEL